MNGVLPKGLEKIGVGVFYQCTSLHPIIIPPSASVKTIPEAAFCCCSALTNVELPDGLQEIEEGAFYQCTSLHAIIIPPYVKVIDNQAFYGCSELMNVELPVGLVKIGWWALATLHVTVCHHYPPICNGDWQGGFQRLFTVDKCGVLRGN